MTENCDNVVSLTEYINIKRGLEREGRTLSPELNQRILRIRESIDRVDKLIKELREDPNNVGKEVTRVD